MLHSNHFKLAALIGIATMAISCSEELPETEKSKVFLNVLAFNTENTMFTRATAEQPPHRIVFKAFDSNGAVVYEATQAAGQNGYGSFDFELSPGEYTFVAVAHDLSKSVSDVAADIVSATQATVPEALIQDTFCKKMDVIVRSGVPFSADMALPRVISHFDLCINDVLPAGVKKLKLVANTAGAVSSGNASFNPSTGLAISNQQYVKEVDISSAVGLKNNSVGLNLFLTDDEQVINITAAAYDADGKEITFHTLSDVPMKRNRKTVAKGNFFTAGGACSFSFSTEWDANKEITY